jgi:hypothetical protein
MHDGPSEEWISKAAELEESIGAHSVSVGGMATKVGDFQDDICYVCFGGFYLPSGRCDHCDLPRPTTSGEAAKGE